MQYTGLKDKNGKEVYEGDLVRFVIGGTVRPITFDKRPITFDKAAFWLGANTLGNLRIDPHEVIGNIYENPELLN